MQTKTHFINFKFNKLKDKFLKFNYKLLILLNIYEIYPNLSPTSSKKPHIIKIHLKGCNKIYI